MNNVKELSDDMLLSEMMDWFRISRNEGGLKEPERKYFQDLCKEIETRGLLDKKNLFRDRS